MKISKAKPVLLFGLIILSLLLFESCKNDSEGTSTSTTKQPPAENKSSDTVQKEIKKIEPELTFYEFAQKFIDDAKISEENFLKYTADKVNGKDPSKSYKTFKSCANLTPQIKDGSITYIKRSISEGSGDPIKHVYKLIFKKDTEGKWKLNTITYKYDLDM